MGKALALVKNSSLRNSVHRSIIKKTEPKLVVAVATVDLTDLKSILPADCRVLAYCNLESAPSYGADESFYGKWREAMWPHLLSSGWTHNTEDKVVPRPVLTPDGHYMIRPSLDAADAYEKFIVENLPAGFDGLFLDQCWGLPPQRWREAQGDLSERWDIYRDWFLERPELRSYRLRLVANTGSLPHWLGTRGARPDGISIEGEHIEGSDPSYFFREYVKYVPNLNVAWAPLSDPGNPPIEVEDLVLGGVRLPE